MSSAADEEDRVLPTKVHAIVLVSKLHKPTLRALAYAKASRPNVLEAVYVAADDKATKRLMSEWEERNLGVPLKVLYSPYREIVRPIIDYATQIRSANPRGVVAVYIPEYVVGRWWEQLLHNQTALRLKGRLLFTPGVMVTSVPYQLQSSQIARAREERERARVKAGDLRRGRGRSPPAARYRRPRDQESRDRSSLRSARQRRERAPRGASHVGERFEAEVGPVAHGGHCVVATTTGSCFVRHALPGERVVVEVTEGRDGDRFWRGDAVSVLSASPDRVPAPVPVRRSRRCAAAATSSTSPPAAQRDLKAAVVREQLARLAGLDLPVTVEEVPPALRWRTRMRYVDLPGGARGLHVHRSDEVVEIDDCLLDAGLLVGRATSRPASRWRRRTAVTTSWSTRRRASGSPTSRRRGCWSRPCSRCWRPSRGSGRSTSTPASGCSPRSWPTRSGWPGGWWPSRARPQACRDARSNLPADRARDAGAGRPGAAGRRTTSRSTSSCSTRRARGHAVPSSSRSSTARRALSPTSPATRPRWRATWPTFAELGYPLRRLRAFDLFPMTHHVECVALLEKGR